MKVWGLGLLLLAACTAPEPRRPGVSVSHGRQMVERLCVEPLPSLPSTRVAPTGAFYELPPGAFIAQGWDRCCSGWPSCGHKRSGHDRCGGCRRSPCCCD